MKYLGGSQLPKWVKADLTVPKSNFRSSPESGRKSDIARVRKVPKAEVAGPPVLLLTSRQIAREE
jgi:hypothetical protein